MRRIYLLVLLLVLGLTACSGDDSPGDKTPGDKTPGNNGPSGDAGADATGDDARGGDVDEGPTSCALQGECAAGQVCAQGVCVAAPGCERLDDWKACVSALDALEPGLGRRASCDATLQHCRAYCLMDSHCAEGELCTDNGHCIAFTGDITGQAPGGAARAPLKAGVANVLMNFPIGLSQGGYGSRMAADNGRYVKSLKATWGQMHGLYARAFVLDNGERQLLFLRLPTVFPSMALHEALARKLQALTGKDWRDSLVLTATHTHSGPTRFWQLPADAMLPLGSFGTDEFSQQVFDWMLDTTFEAAKAALDDLSPAKFGWTIVEEFDTDDHIASDRWKQTPPFDDNRMLLFRIDDADGNPRAVMVSFGAHGTIHDEVYFTGDAPAGYERGLERAMADKYGHFVPVMYLNSNGGTMSPRGDHWGHESVERFEATGHELGLRAMPAIDAMAMHTDLNLAAVTHRFPITYETIGYGPTEWDAGAMWRGTPNGTMDFGALNCLGNQGDQDPATHFSPPVTDGCMPVHYLYYHRPVSLFARSQITALKVGDLTMITIPGEASMEVGWQVTRDARDQFGLDPLKTWVFGYAQDHQFYITPTNLRGELPVYPGISTPMAPDEYPDFAFSWLQGGYEAGLSVWGWKFGDFIVARAMEGVAKLVGAPVQMAFEAPLPLEYSRVDEPVFPIDPSDAAAVGTVVEDVPQTVKRLEPIEFAWVGGDPGAEMPQAPLVTLERKVGEGFEPVYTLNMRPYDNREMVMLTRVRESGEQWEWVVYWEETQQFALGHYRFRVAGHYLNADGARTAYETTSREFELVRAEGLNITIDAPPEEMPRISGTLGYPAGVPASLTNTPADRGKVQGNFRMRHPRVALGQSAPLLAGQDVEPDGVTVTVRLAQDGTQVAQYTGATLALETREETVRGRDGVPVTRYTTQPGDLPMAPGTYEVEVEVRDLWGNRDVTTTTVEVP